MAKKANCARNWNKYNKSLVQRGSITLWINEEVAKQWNEPLLDTQDRGRPKTYTDLAIETCVTLKVLFNLPYRQCQGFIESIISMLRLKIKAPSFTQLCRRQKNLKIKLKHTVKGSIHVVVDATGLKIFGEGEWKVRQHGYSKHRMWRKLHVGIDVESQQFVMAELTDNHIGECKLLKPLLDQYKGKIYKVGGDKGYDSFACHEAAGEIGAVSAILPQRKAKVRSRLKDGEKPLVRDEIVRRMRDVGRKKWKKEVGYHRRSLVETAFYRYKTVFGSKLRSTSMENQKIETLVACNILNKFMQLSCSLVHKK